MNGRRTQEGAIYVISVAAELAGVHPQTLRVYERKGLVHPQRTAGNTRRYSDEDIARLRRIQQLTNEGVNLAGVLQVLDLEEEIKDLRARLEEAEEDLQRAEEELKEVIAGRSDMALVPLKDIRRVRRALKSDLVERGGGRRVFAAPPVLDREQE